MEKERNEWVWEPRIIVRGTPDEIMAYKTMFGDVCNATHRGSTTVGGKLFINALERAMDDPSVVESSDTMPIAALKHIVAINKKERDKKLLRKIYETEYRENPDGFVTLCSEWGIQDDVVTEILAFFDVSVQDWNEIATAWLCDKVLNCNEKVVTKEIRAQAIEAGIIDNSIKDWNKLRQLAHRKGFNSTEKGYWQLPCDIVTL